MCTCMHYWLRSHAGHMQLTDINEKNMESFSLVKCGRVEEYVIIIFQ